MNQADQDHFFKLHGIEYELMHYNIVPVPKPRQTRSDRWKKRPCVLRYRSFADKVRAAGLHIPPEGTMITFGMPMPKSWSKKKKAIMVGEPHMQVPDISNLLKAVEDAIYHAKADQDDSRIWSYGALRKVWSRQGFIILCAPRAVC